MTKLKNINLYIIALFPLSLIIGPLIAEIFLAFVIFSFLFCNYHEKKINIFENKFISIFFLFYLYINLVSLLNSPDLYLSFKNSLFYIRFIIFSLGIYYFLIVSKNKFDLIFLIFSFVLIINSLNLFFQFLNGKDILNNVYIYDKSRFSGFFGEEAVYGSYVQKILPAYFAIFFFLENRNNTKENIIFIITLLLSYSSLILSGDRAALFLCSIFLILFAILSNFNYKKKLTFLLIFFTLILSFFSLNKNSYDRIVTKTLNEILVKDISKDKKIYFFSEIHQGHYLAAVKIFDKQKILGYGVKSFRIKCNDPDVYINKYSCNTHPHNYYFQLLAETGLIGFCIILGIFLFLTFKLFQIFLNNFKTKKKSIITV